ILGVVEAAVAIKLGNNDLRRPITARESREFLRAYTLPGDVLVVGPPFVLAAADPDGIDARNIRYVVPLALYLSEFTEEDFLRDVRQNSTVYVGYPEYYSGVLRDYKSESSPIFSNARFVLTDFRGDQVLIARQQPVFSRRSQTTEPLNSE